MAEKSMNAVLKLRRDSENNFNRSNIILQKGEIALVTTPFSGTQIKVGDGTTRFKDLNYNNFGLLVEGFKNSDTEFVYPDNSTVVNPENHLLFMDRNTGFMYYWDHEQSKYMYVNRDIVPVADASTAGIAKLYQTVDGDNTDGAVSQFAVKGAFNQVQTAANNLVWKIDEEDDEKLVTNFSDLQSLSIVH